MFKWHIKICVIFVSVPDQHLSNGFSNIKIDFIFLVEKYDFDKQDTKHYKTTDGIWRLERISWYWNTVTQTDKCS